MSSSRFTSTAAITVTPIPIPTAADVATAVARDGCYAFYSPQLAMFLGAQSVQQPYPSISIAFCLVT